MDEREFCDMTSMCSESFSGRHILSSGEDVPCEFCEKVIQHWVDTWTANTTQEEFKQVLESLCRRLDRPGRVKHCLHIVDDWYIPWFQFLLHEVNPHAICTLVGLCGNGQLMQVESTTSISVLFPPRTLQGQVELGHHRQLPPPEDDGDRLVGGYFVPATVVEAEKPGCVICEYGISELRRWIAQNKTEAAIEDAVYKLCGRLHHAVKDQCDNLVTKYGPAIVQMLVREVDPDEVCARLGLCPRPGPGADLLEHQAALPPQLQVPKRKEDTCALCEFALGYVEDALNDTSNQEMIRNLLDSVCYRMPHAIENECFKLVNEYTEEIIDLFIREFTAEEICAELRLCESKKKLKNDEKCVLCEYAVTTLDKIIGDKHNEREVKEALDKLCSYLPQSISDECTKFVDDYSDMIIDMITHDLTPDEVCQQLGLCKKKKTGHERPYCALCEYAIGEVDKLITDKHNEEEIKDVLDRICYELTAPIKKECLKLVNRYTDDIIDMFVAEYTPQEVCAALRLCNPAQSPPPSNAIPPLETSSEVEVALIVPEETTLAEPRSQKPLCVICEFAMSVLEQKILNNRTMDMVKRSVQMLCSYLPGAVAEDCEEFVDEYGDKIIHLIVVLEANPAEICADLNLCDGVSGRRRLMGLGRRRCAWGPSYWCMSRFHARVCGTMRHCENNVWNN